MQMRACLAVCRLATPMDSSCRRALAPLFSFQPEFILKAVVCVCKNCVGRRRAAEQQNSESTAPVAKCQLDDDSPMSNGLSIRSSVKFS